MSAGCASGPGCPLDDGDDIGPGPLCRMCMLRAERDIRALVLDYRDLEQILPRGTAPAAGTRVGGTSTPAVPVALHVDALQRDMVWTLGVWEPPVREAAGLSPEPTGRVRGGWAVTRAVSVIAPRVDVLAGLAPTWGFGDGLDAGPVLRDGVQAVMSLRSLRARARSVLGLSALTHDLPGECSTCGLSALRRDDGSDTVWCAGCEARCTYDDYVRYVGLILADTRMPRATHQ